MKVLLINPVNRPEAKPQYFPLGLAYVAALLRNRGIYVNVLDLNAHRYDDVMVERMIRRSNHDLFALTGMLTEYNEVRRLANLIKEFQPHKLLVLGGGLATLMPDLVLQNIPIDIVVRGEGEETILNLAELNFQYSLLAEIDGISYRQRDEIIHNQNRKPIINIDVLPFPARDLFPYEIYFENMKRNWMFNQSYRATNIITSRGCPYRCIYCDHSLWGFKFRQRSVANIIEELRMLKQDYGIEAFVLSDDTFSICKEWVADFCEGLSKSGLGLPWMCNCRVNHVNKQMFRDFKKAGCVTVGFGIESGSNKILKELNKNATVEQADKALSLAKKMDFKILTYLIIGSFSETKETVQETVSLLRKHAQTGGFNFLTPIPGTTLYHEAVRLGHLPDDAAAMLKNWNKWQDTLLVNLTKRLSDQELKALKRRAEKQINLAWPTLVSLWRRKGLLEVVRKVLEQFGLNGTTQKMLGLPDALVRRWLKFYGARTLEPPHVKRILVVKIYGIGNALLALPFLRAVRQNFPNAKISLLVENRAEAAFRNLDLYDELLTIDLHTKSLVKKIRQLIQLICLRPQVIFSTFPMSNGRLSKAYAYIGARNIVGHPIVRNKVEHYTHPLDYDINRHEVLLNLDLLRPYGITPDEEDCLNFPVAVQDADFARTFIDCLRKGTDVVVGMHCGGDTDMPEKYYPAKKFAAVADQLVDRKNARIFLFGGPNEKKLGAVVIGHMKYEPVNLIGEYDLLKVFALIAECDLFISYDSGLMHAAAAVNTPVLGLFGPTMPNKNAPWGKTSRIIASDLYCSPCHRVGHQIHCSNTVCMDDIQVDEVVETAIKML